MKSGKWWTRSCRLQSKDRNQMHSICRYEIFEINMDEYLDEEVEALTLNFDVICKR